MKFHIMRRDLPCWQFGITVWLKSPRAVFVNFGTWAVGFSTWSERDGA